MKIILVDDNKGFRKGIKFLLMDDYEIIGEASNGIEAIELLSKTNPDIVLMDIEMPELNGIEATKKLLWKNPAIRFIAITMYKDKAYLQELVEAGFKGCVFKTEVTQELKPAIKKVMSGRYSFPSDIKMTDDFF